MTASQLQTLLVHQLKPGMVLHSIVQQTGRLMVKSKGKIKHKGTIEQLIACGVQSVKIESFLEQDVEKLPASIANIKSPTKPAVPIQTLTAANDSETDPITDTIELGSDSDFGEDEFTETTESTAEAPKTDRQGKKQIEETEQLVIDCKKLHQKMRINIEKKLPIDFSESKQLVSKLHQTLMQDQDALLCLSMIRNQGEYLSNHAMHVAILLCHFAKYLGMSNRDCERLALLGYFFDIGMVQVPREILHKQGAPSKEEQAIIQSHVQKSIDLLTPFNLDAELMLAIEQHHERLDGSGYPNQLQGEDIHIFSRMLAIVDCYDAMTTNRPFQKKSSPAAALKIISNKNYGYDLKLALQFIRCMGVYPVGSLVIMNNQHIGIVIKNHERNALKPKVKTFYSISKSEYFTPEEHDLAKANCKFSIVKPTLPEHHRLDMGRVSF
jgi:HD-GYP domain-containing protein (c-di-GMP phosphodiesterase class II)